MIGKSTAAVETNSQGKPLYVSLNTSNISFVASIFRFVCAVRVTACPLAHPEFGFRKLAHDEPCSTLAI